jgi:hypothetical protein
MDNGEKTEVAHQGDPSRHQDIVKERRQRRPRLVKERRPVKERH